MDGSRSLADLHGWYDVVVTVAEDAGFEYRFAGHIETGRDSMSDPAMGGLIKLKA
jgi:phospholipase C